MLYLFGNKQQRVKNMSEYSPNDMTNNTRPYVFVSYSHKDEREMKQLKLLFDTDGICYWYDKGLHSGDDWNSVIAKYLEGAAACVVLLSPNSAESEYVKNELSFAISRNIPLHILMLEDFEIPPDIDIMTCRIQRIKKEAGYERRLIDALSEDIGTVKSDPSFLQKIRKFIIRAKDNKDEDNFVVKIFKWLLKMAGKVIRGGLIFSIVFCVGGYFGLKMEEENKSKAVIPSFNEFSSLSVSKKEVENNMESYTYELPDSLASSRTQELVSDYLDLLTSEYKYNKLGETKVGETTWYWFEYTGKEEVTGTDRVGSDGVKMYEYDVSIAVWGNDTYGRIRIYTAKEIKMADYDEKFVEN